MAKSPVNLSSHQKEFVKCLEDATVSGQHLRDTFDDFITAASATLRQAVHVFKHAKRCEEIEAEYVKIENKYGKRMIHIKTALSHMTAAFEIEPHDFLGDIYGAIGSTNANTGQFFTPYALSVCCANMIVSKEHYESVVARGDRFSIQEPAVGAGGMIIPLVKFFQEWDAHPSTWYVECVDVDIRCVRMAYIQLTLLGVPALVRHGNTLSLESWDCWPTLVMALNPYIPGRTKRESSPSPERTSTNPPPEGRDRSPPAPMRKLHLGRSASPAT